MRYLAIVFGAILLLAGLQVQAQDETEPAEAAEQVEEVQEVEDVEEEVADDEEEVEERRRVRRLGDVVGEGSEEWSMDIPAMDFPAEPIAPQPEVSLPDANQDARLQRLLTARAFSPDDPDLQAELGALMDEVAADARQALAGGNLELADRLAGVIRQVQGARPVVAEVEAAVVRGQNIANNLAQAEAALAEGRLVAPPGDNAAELFLSVQETDPGNAEAADGLARTYEALLALAIEQAEELDFEGAEQTVEQAESLLDAPDEIAQTRDEISTFRTDYIDELDRQVRADIDDGRFDEADDGITQLVALGHDRARIDQLRSSLEDAVLYGSFEPGQVFSDPIPELNTDGPDMVVMPAGSFMMGSPEDEQDRLRNEGPRHRVTFDRGFAMAQTETSVGEFRLFVEDTGFVTDAERSGGSRVYDLNTGRMDRQRNINWRHDYTGREADDDLPVIHVSWEDTQAYVDWLSEKTGRSYRLPTEAEFEYALRAGSQTPYWWGEGAPDDAVENVTGSGDSSPTGARWTSAFRRYSDGFWGPAPVGSLQPNPFGLYDVGGNVMEWVEDCWHDSYVRAPSDGSAWVNPGCDRRVLRGGSWSSTPAMSRSAFRLSSSPTGTDMRVGFRVARDI